MTWLGLDIGGANLKAADGHGWARSVPFALWREPERLAIALSDLIFSAPVAERLAVTMTGELCDCFRAKSDGVRFILAAVEEAAAGRDVRVYLVDGRLVPIDEARERPELAAASNWHALATFAGRFAPRSGGLLIDIGSTTTDIVPLLDGRPIPRGSNDCERLLFGELVYTGTARTPICAITSKLPYRGNECPVAAELFATSVDAYVLLGDVPEDEAATWTADGRPLTIEFAGDRMARMICVNRTQFGSGDAQAAAERVCEAQLGMLRDALRQVVSVLPHPPSCCVTCGGGEFLARRLVASGVPDAAVISLGSQIGHAASVCAPAHALAVLADGQNEAI
jgi:probable H4MPT-linked C1 transfer pathway protein